MLVCPSGSKDFSSYIQSSPVCNSGVSLSNTFVFSLHRIAMVTAPLQAKLMLLSFFF